MTDSSLRLESTYANLPEIFYTRLSPVPVSKPKVVIFNQKLAEEMGLDLTHFNEQQKADLLAGNLIPEGCTPFAQAYAGHQFGNFTMLGDGRAIILGEHLSSSGKRFDLQYKGSGRTPYSRGATDVRLLAPCSANILSAKPCILLASPQPEAWLWYQPVRPCIEKTNYLEPS